MFIPILILYAFPVLAFILGAIGLWKNPSQWRTFLPMCICLVFVGAYSYSPVSGSNEDLIRYFEKIEFYGRMSFPEVVSYEGSVLFSQYLLFWLCGNIHMEHLVPAISVATVYAVAGYITCDTAERYNARRYIVLVLLVQLLALPYYWLINNVRNVFGLSLVILAVYLDVVKHKKTAFVWFCYIFGSMMHLSVFILVIFRCISALGKKYFEIIMMSQLFFAVFVSKIYEWGGIFASGGAIGYTVNVIIKRAYLYLNAENNIGSVKYLTLSMTDATNVQRIIMVAAAVLAVLMVYYILRFSKSGWFMDDSKFYAFVGMISLTTISFHAFFTTPNYWRFGAALYVTIGVLLIPLLCSYKKLTLFPRVILYANFVMLPVMGWVQFVTYRRLGHFAGWALETLTTNYITILFDLIKGIFI